MKKKNVIVTIEKCIDFFMEESDTKELKSQIRSSEIHRCLQLDCNYVSQHSFYYKKHIKDVHNIDIEDDNGRNITCSIQPHKNSLHYIAHITLVVLRRKNISPTRFYT